MLRNSASRYGWPHQLIHWLMAVAIIGMFTVGLYMEDLPLGPDKLKLYGLHKSVGSILLAAVVLRYFWRIINPVPSLSHMTKMEGLGAHLGHYALYALMLALPVSGWLMSSAAGFPVSVFGWFTLPDLIAPDRNTAALLQEVHELLAFAIILTAAGHALAALYHHFIKQDTVLRRMLPWSKLD